MSIKENDQNKNSGDCVAACGALLELNDHLDQAAYLCTRAEGHAGAHRALAVISTTDNIYHYCITWLGDMNDEPMSPYMSLKPEPLLDFSSEWAYFQSVAKQHNLAYTEGSRSNTEVAVTLSRRAFDTFLFEREKFEMAVLMEDNE